MVPWRTSNRKALWGTGGIGQHCDCAGTCWGVAGSPGGERLRVTGCQNRDSRLGRGQGRHRGDLRHVYWGTWWECHYNRETNFHTSKYLVCTIWLRVSVSQSVIQVIWESYLDLKQSLSLCLWQLQQMDSVFVSECLSTKTKGTVMLMCGQ